MDQLDEWAVRGRVATAIRSVRESAARLVVDSAELTEAVAEAERLGIRNEALADERLDWSFQSVGASVEWLIPRGVVPMFGAGREVRS